MRVSSRTALIVGGVTLAAAAVLGLVSVGLVSSTFRELERDDAATDLARVTAAIERDAATLGTLAADWSVWDDTYDYVTGAGDEYEDSNLVADTFDALGLTGLVITDLEGAPVYSSGFDHDAYEFTAADERVLQELMPGGLLDTGDDPDAQIHGIIRAHDQLLTVGAGPVSDSDGEVDPVGRLAMARPFDDRAVAGLAEQLSLDISVDPPTGDGGISTDGRVITARGPLRGLDGTVVADVVVRQPRDLVAAGRRFGVVVVLAGLGVLLVAAAGMLILQHRLVLRRLSSVEQTARSIADGAAPEARVHEDGDDEITSLARTLNTMLDRQWTARRQLADHNAELQAAARMKDDFVATVSHEFRTPLTVVRGLLETLRQHRDRLSEAQRADLEERMGLQARRLERLVDDVLVLSRVTDGGIEPRRRTVALVGAVADVATDVGDVPVEAAIDPTITVGADPDHLHRVLVNLVDNARKYGRPPVVLTARRVDERVEIAVEDQGDGVPDGFVDSLFGRFTQADASDTKPSGAGLGLAIVASLVAANDGEIRYARRARGARFVVTLPAAATLDVSAQPVPAPSRTAAR